ncbi:aminopeptidase [Kordiimonas sediminis]|uniref:Aminopeptidase n=1 Tax=Kordiimonas sediminis TaxID=1735581 RepID=A0A919E9D2_9PROT|nr:DUF4910 domain-containing protein [Kordiimonas sediminis]GHF31025.1 aminopeptidase [Kordiimonas sediminis]
MLNSVDRDEEYLLLDKAFDHLFPILRSITGPGLERSLDFFEKFMPLQRELVPSGAKVFDWEVPLEWHCKRAMLTAPCGTVICDTDVNNLHVLNYSEGIKGRFSLEQLQPHLHSLPSLPTAVPYVTSYYQRTWGFCLKHEDREKLAPGTYEVSIDASFKEGGVPFAHTLLEGQASKEILLSSYLCHPSLANNELSGPLVLLALYNRIKKWPRRRYSYRFLLNPETIGALCFLSRYGAQLKDNLHAGLVLTCLGGPTDKLRYKASRNGDNIFDKMLSKKQYKQLRLPEQVIATPFCPLGGSDERQYGAPGIQLPVGQIARTVYGEYDGYHNSLDTKEFMSIDQLVKSVDTIESLLLYGEVADCPVNLLPFGEPQLGKRGLYPNMNNASSREKSDDTRVDGRTELNRRLKLLNMADGKTDLFEIAEAADCQIDDLIAEVERLEEAGMIAYHCELPKL